MPAKGHYVVPFNADIVGVTFMKWADFHVNGEKLTKVDYFKYLGSYISNDCKLDKAASSAVGRLRERVFNCRELTTETKVKVYNQCVIPILVYGSETWTLYRHQIKKLRTIQ